jgi:hypothetical protein
MFLITQPLYMHATLHCNTPNPRMALKNISGIDFVGSKYITSKKITTRIILENKTIFHMHGQFGSGRRALRVGDFCLQTVSPPMLTNETRSKKPKSVRHVVHLYVSLLHFQTGELRSKKE